MLRRAHGHVAVADHTTSTSSAHANVIGHALSGVEGQGSSPRGLELRLSSEEQAGRKMLQDRNP